MQEKSYGTAFVNEVVHSERKLVSEALNCDAHVIVLTACSKGLEVYTAKRHTSINLFGNNHKRLQTSIPGADSCTVNKLLISEVLKE